MRITRESEYAIRIVDYLARGNRLAGSAEISEETAAPLRFTKNILQKLAHKGILNAYRGMHGGYRLARLPEEISLYDVMEATDGLIQLSGCLEEGHECPYIADKERCPYQAAFLEISGDMEHKMRKFRFSSDAYGDG